MQIRNPTAARIVPSGPKEWPGFAGHSSSPEIVLTSSTMRRRKLAARMRVITSV
jgi:hypothetical protein